MIELQVDSARVVVRLERIAAGMRASLLRAVNAATIELQGYVRAQKLHGGMLKARTGNLSRAVIAQPATDEGGRIMGRVVVDRSAPYGAILHRGVAHSWTIVPKNRKALRFAAGGSIVFAKRVVHPPLGPFPFLTSALEERRAAITDRIRAAVRAQIQGEL